MSKWMFLALIVTIFLAESIKGEDQISTTSNKGECDYTIFNDLRKGLPMLPMPVFNFQYITSDAYGVEFACDSFYVTDNQDNSVEVYDHNGNWCHSFSQFREGSVWGWCDLAWDGDTLYASDWGDNFITKFGRHGEDYGDIPGPLPFMTALAYDPTTCHLWTAGLTSYIYEFDKTGTVIDSFQNSYTIYGMAWDDASPDGPWLWISTFAPPPTYPLISEVLQFDPINGIYTGAYPLPVPQPGYEGRGLVLGCCFTKEWDHNRGVLFISYQSGVYGIEIFVFDSSKALHSGWNLISLPIIPDNPNPDSCFGDDIPTVNIYAYDEPSKSYYNPDNLLTGKGYMLQSLWNGPILDVWGYTLWRLPYTITGLTKTFPQSYYGWNIAGNPLMDTLDFDNLIFDNVNFLYKYFTGYQYIFYPGGGAPRYIPDWWGFWVQVINPGMGSITIDTTGVTKRGTNPICWDWRLKISVKSGDLIDEHNYIGVSSDDRAVDVVDFILPLPEYVQAYFEGGEAGYQQLVLDGNKDTYEIPLDVEVNTSNPEVTISWEFEGYPEGIGMYLVDGEDEIDMSENSSYSFINSFEGGNSEIPTLDDPVLLLSRKAEGEIHYFTIRVEPLICVEGAGLTTKIFNINPNPFTSNVNIHFVLSKRTEASLGIYDVSGRLIQELIDRDMDAGEHGVVFDGSSLPSGVYFLKLNAGEYTTTTKLLKVR